MTRTDTKIGIKGMKITEGTEPTEVMIPVEESRALTVSTCPVSPYVGMAGLGLEDVTPQDVTLPRVRILHKQSQECDENNPLYIPAARMGMFIDNAGNLYTSLTVVPCKFINNWIECIVGKQKGGFVRSYGADDSLKAKCQQNDKRQWILPNGHEFQQNSLWFLWLLEGFSATEKVPVKIARPAVLQLRSTQLRPSRDWMNIIKNLEERDEVGRRFTPPIFAAYYRLSTMLKTEEGNTWALLVPTYLGRTAQHEGGEELLGEVLGCYKEAQELLNKPAAVDKLVREGDAQADDEVPF